MIPQRAYLSLLEKGWKPKHIRSYINMNFNKGKSYYRTVLGFEDHSFECDFPTKRANEILNPLTGGQDESI